MCVDGSGYDRKSGVAPAFIASTTPSRTEPHLPRSLIAAGLLFALVYDTGNQVNDLIVDAVVAGALGMVWTGAKVLLRTDYHGWDNFIAWCRLDARCLDTREWDGARLASFPLRSPYRSGALGDAD